METHTTPTPALPPEPRQKHWFWGHIPYLIKDVLHYLQSTQREVGKIAWLRSKIAKICIVSDPEYIKYVLQDNNKNYVKGNVFRFLKPLVGNGLLTSEGDFWRRQRRLAQPAFHKERLAAMSQAMVTCTEQMIAEWQQRYQDGDTINMTLEMNKIALTIVSNALFKSDVKGDFEIINQNLGFLLERITYRFRHPLKQIPLWIPTPTNLKERAAIRALEKVIHQIIAKKRAEGTRKENGDLLDMLMEAVDEETGERMSDKQLRDEVLTIFLAGHETSANTLAYMWWLLSLNPETADKISQELTTVLQGRTPTFEDLKQLPYCRQVINETLRLYPPAYAIERKTIAADQIGGYHIPKETNVIISSYVLHRMPELWGDEADQFQPERFETELVKKQPRFAYFPFGGGPRLCIGDQFALFEITIILAMVWKHYRFEPLVPQPQLALEPLVTLRPKENIRLKIRRI